MPQAANGWKQQNRSVEGNPWTCSPCPQSHMDLAPSALGQRQEQRLTRRAQCWLAGLPGSASAWELEQDTPECP